MGGLNVCLLNARTCKTHTRKTLTHKILTRKHSYTQTLYASRAKPLRTKNPYTQNPYAQKPLHAKPLHTKTLTRKNRYTQTFTRPAWRMYFRAFVIVFSGCSFGLCMAHVSLEASASFWSVGRSLTGWNGTTPICISVSRCSGRLYSAARLLKRREDVASTLVPS